MRCSACGRDNPDGFKFCGECGSALQQERVCPSCETVNAPSLTFRGQCGSALAIGASPQAASASPVLHACPRGSHA